MKKQCAFSLLFLIFSITSNNLFAAELQVALEPYYSNNFVSSQQEIFKSKTGHAVRFSQVNNVFEKMIKAAGSGYSWDVVELPYAKLQEACELGVLVEIDVSKLTTSADGSPAKENFLPGTLHKCGIGTRVYSMLYAYNDNNVFGERPRTISDFFDLTRFPGRRGLRRGAQYNLEMALIADQVAPDKVYELLETSEGVDRAIRKLDQIKRQIVWWDKASSSVQLLADGEVVMTTGYMDRFHRSIQKEQLPIKMVWDGQVWDVDMMAIPKDSKNKELAQQYLNFLTSPDQATKLREDGLVTATARNSSPGDEFTCASGTCACAGSNVCSSTCCDRTPLTLFKEFGVQYSADFWLKNRHSIESKMLMILGN